MLLTYKRYFQMTDKLVVPAKPDMIVSYPNTLGQSVRYSLQDHREYFRKFSGGSMSIFQLALENVLDGDLLSFAEQCDLKRTSTYGVYKEKCEPIFDNCYGGQLDENTISINQYVTESREFGRRIFDLYRYAKTSVAHLGIPKTGLSVKKIHELPEFDSGAFVIK